MQILGSNLLWHIGIRRSSEGKIANQFNLGSAIEANKRKDAEQKELNSRLSALSVEEKKPDTEKTFVHSDPSFILNGEEVKEKTAALMEEYYKHTGNLVDSLTYMEEKLKYLQSEYEKYESAGDTEHALKIKEHMEKQYQDMSFLVDANLGLQNAILKLSERLYGKNYSEEVSAQLGDTASGLAHLSETLKGSGSLEDALDSLAAAKEQAKEVNRSLAKQFQEYTGKELTSYEYKTAEDYQDMAADSILINKELIPDESLKLNPGDYGINFKDLHELSNLLDKKA